MNVSLSFRRGRKWSVRVALALAGLVAPIAAPAYGQTADPKIEIELSASPVVTQTSLIRSSETVINDLADSFLDRLSGNVDQHRVRAALIRVARLYFVNLPIAALGHVEAHDTGHAARSREFGVQVVHRGILRWPWPVPIANSIIETLDSGSHTPQRDTSTEAGGEEAARTQQDRLLESIYAGEHATYFEWAMLAYAKLDMPLYVLSDLRSSRLKSLSAFTEDEPLADPRQLTAIYAATKAIASGQPGVRFQDWRNEGLQIRRNAWLNFADFGLVEAFRRVVTYAVTGEREATPSAIRIGRLGIVPAAYSTFTSRGLQRGVQVLVRNQNHLLDFEWGRTDDLSGRELDSVRVGVRPRRQRWGPDFQSDLWQRAGQRPGFHFEVGATGPTKFAPHLAEVGIRLGYKTAGFLRDQPMRAGLVGSVSIGVKY